jgi:hypothetical protein
MAMRSFLKEQEDIPPGLGKRTLEPHFMAVVRKSSKGHDDSAVTQRAPRSKDPPILIPFGQTSDRPVVVESSPDQEPLGQGAPQFTRIGMIESELKSQRERAERSQIQFTSMFKALQESLERVLPPSTSRMPTAARRVEEHLEDLPSTSPSERVEAWRGMQSHTPQPVRRTEPSPSPSLCESIMSESLLPQLPVEDEPYVPRMLAEGQSCYDWDHEGAKWDTREDLSTEVKERLKALDSVARSIASINRFPQE